MSRNCCAENSAAVVRTVFVVFTFTAPDGLVPGSHFMKTNYLFLKIEKITDILPIFLKKFMVREVKKTLGLFFLFLFFIVQALNKIYTSATHRLHKGIIPGVLSHFDQRRFFW